MIVSSCAAPHSRIALIRGTNVNPSDASEYSTFGGTCRYTFARFLVSESPEHLAQLQRVLGLPFKRGSRNAPIEYLEPAEVETLLRQIDSSTDTGRRDYTLFALMFNTGARVQEVLGLKLSDVRTEPPYQVRLHGKGGKIRLCPIWAATAARLQALAQQIPGNGMTDALLFTNRRGGKSAVHPPWDRHRPR